MNRFLICCLLLVYYSTTSKAQFGPPNTISKNGYKDNPVAVDKADFNQDGFEDVIIAFYNAVFWWPNNGNNGFSEPIQLSIPPSDTAFLGWNFHDLIVADIDQDGNKDVVCAVNYIRSFSQFGSNTSLVPVPSTIPPGPPPPPPGKEQGRVFIYHGLGNGLFAEGKFISNNFGHLSNICAVNLDTTQELEIFAISQHNTLLSLYNLPDTLEAYSYNNVPGKIAILSNTTFDDTLFSTETILSDSSIQGFKIEFGDIENDGDLDLFFSAGFNGFAGWMENLGGGIFGPKQWITGVNGHITSYFKLADLNGDSLIDFIYNNYSGGSYWQRNFGSGQFGNPMLMGASDSQFGNFSVSDVDGDSDMDIIIPQNGVYYLENVGDGSSFSNIKLDHVLTNCIYTLTSNVNNDNTIEILGVGSPYYGTLSIYQRNNDGTWNNRLVVYPQLTNIQNVLSGDIDNDSDIDIVVGSMYDNKLVFFNNIGAGNFSEPLLISNAVFQLKDLCLSDVDNDLDLDIIATSIADSNIQLFRNNGFGEFQNPEIIADHLYSAERITSSDFDQDGNMDIVGTFSFGLNSAYSKVYSFRNAGNGVFEQAHLVTDSVSWGKAILVTADLDQDQFPDLISASSTTLVWLKSLGNGLFDNVSVISNQLQTIKEVKPTYNYQNQRIDLLVAAVGSSQSPNYFMRFENTGGGVFAPLEALIPIVPLRSGVALEPMDFDLDNDEDIVIYFNEASTYTFKSSLLLNDGAANFAAPDTFLPFNNGGYSMKFIHADLNDDAYPDLIRFFFGYYEDASIQWQANTGGMTTSIEKTTDLFTVYPNPNNGRFYIHQLNAIDKGSVKLYSLDGREINCNVSYFSNETEISVNAEAGIYILSWNCNNRKEFRKVIIQQ